MNGGCPRTVVGCWNWRDSTHGSKGSYALSVPFDAALGASVQAATRVRDAMRRDVDVVTNVLVVNCQEVVACQDECIGPSDTYFGPPERRSCIDSVARPFVGRL